MVNLGFKGSNNSLCGFNEVEKTVGISLLLMDTLDSAES